MSASSPACGSVSAGSFSDNDNYGKDSGKHRRLQRVTGSAANLRLLGASPASGSGRDLIDADGWKIGIVLWLHPRREQLDLAGRTDIPASVIDIDIVIGEVAALQRGDVSNAIRLVAETALSDAGIPFVMAPARLKNPDSQRAFAETGFRRGWEFEDLPSGLHVLMVRHRHEGRVA